MVRLSLKELKPGVLVVMSGSFGLRNERWQYVIVDANNKVFKELNEATRVKEDVVYAYRLDADAYGPNNKVCPFVLKRDITNQDVAVKKIAESELTPTAKENYQKYLMFKLAADVNEEIDEVLRSQFCSLILILNMV